MKPKLKKISVIVIIILSYTYMNSFYFSVANGSGNKIPTPEPQGQDAWKEIPADTVSTYTGRYNPENDKTLRGVHISNDILQKILSDHPEGIEKIYFQFADIKGSADVVYFAEPKNKADKVKYYMSNNAVIPTCPVICPEIQ